jgi:glycine cleavage system H lipoate-binding protein
MNYPENYRYTKEHEWVALKAAYGTIGITFHAQKNWATSSTSICRSRGPA